VACSIASEVRTICGCLKMNWVKTQDLLPPEGVIVKTMDSSGCVQQLVRQGKLYFFPDMSMYVYYVPVFWRSCSEEELTCNERTTS